MFPNYTGPTYGLLHGLALILFVTQLTTYLSAVFYDPACDYRVAEKRRARHIAGLMLLYVLCNFIVAKLFFDLRRDPTGIQWANYLRLEHWRTGFWGWPIAFLPLALLYPFVFRLNRVLTLRALALTLPMVVFVQKAACLAAGCCTGVPTDLPWALTFRVDSLCPTPGVPVHPVPAYDMLFALTTSVILNAMDRREAARAFLFPVFVFLYGVSRLVTEFFRPEFHGRLSLSQYLAGGAAVAFLLLLLFCREPWRRLLARGNEDGTELSRV